MRRSTLALIAALLALAVAPFPQRSAAASCAEPSLLEVEDLVLHPGEQVTVEGRGFVDGCPEPVHCPDGFGCDADCDVPEPRYAQDVKLHLVQPGRRWLLDVEDAGDDSNVTWTFTVPSDAAPGPARLIADGSSGARLRIR